MELKGSKDEMMQDETWYSIKLKFDLFNISIISPKQQMGHFLSNPSSSQIFLLRKTIYDFRKDLNNVSKCAQIWQYTKGQETFLFMLWIYNLVPYNNNNSQICMTTDTKSHSHTLSKVIPYRCSTVKKKKIVGRGNWPKGENKLLMSVTSHSMCK